MSCDPQVPVVPEATPAEPAAQWFALHTRPRHEKSISAKLREKAIASFVPTLAEVHRWSDRRKRVEVPVFSCYVFVQVANWRTVYYEVLQVPGVFQWVRLQEEPSPVPEHELEAVKALLAKAAGAFPYPYPELGQRVRLRGGAMDGVEGILVGRRGDRKLVVSINLIRQSVAVCVEGYDIEAVR